MSAAIRILFLGLLVWVTGASSACSATRNVVLLFDERPELPGMAMLESEFVRTLTAGSADRVELYREPMDLSRFGSDTYRSVLRDFLKAKYADKKIDVVVGIIGPALDFLLAHGGAVFPGASIVFCGIDRRELGSRFLPPEVRGVLIKREFAPTLELALKLHPRTSQAVVVAGTSDFDKRLLDQARQEFHAFEGRIGFTYLTSLPMAELLAQLSALPTHTIVLFTTIFRDGAGETFFPHDAVQRVSESASAPVYGFLDQYLGRGIVGGSLYSFSAHGAATAKLVLQVLAGTTPSDTHVIEPETNKVMFDWRQMRRWKISEVSLPANSEIQFRKPSLWRQYGLYLIIGIVVLLIEAAIIAALLVEHHRRRLAERVSGRRTLEAIHLNRSATASALSASIGHELRQPLTAILNYAAAAEVHLSRSPLNRPVLKKIVDEIQQSGRRAAQIISHLRDLLRRTDDIDPTEFEIEEVIEAAVELLQPAAIERGVSINVQNSGTLMVRGDHVQLQQVILNLAINAMDAMSDCASDRRKLQIRAMRTDDEVVVSLADTGPGIPEKNLKKVFDTFYTTKEGGTGIGLSITRSIIENHGGKIWADNGEGGGAIFTLSLPLVKAAAGGRTASTSRRRVSDHTLAENSPD